MSTLIQSLETYVHKTLGISVKVEKWSSARSQPVIVQNQYEFYVIRMLDQRCLLLVAEEGENTPLAIRKHVNLVLKTWDGPAVYVTRALASNARDRLVEYKLPFIVPGNQLYLPDLGLDMREHFKTIRAERQSLSPATQAVIIRALTASEYSHLDSQLLADRFDYTAMTFKRACDEIERFEIGTARKEGRTRVLDFSKRGRELWEAVLPILRSPIKRRRWVLRQTCEQHCVRSGLTALAHYTMLAPLEQAVYAISSEDWKTLRQDNNLRTLSQGDPDAQELEIWSYSPRLLSETDIVDRFSLYVSLRGHSDERVEAALEEMMGTIAW